MGRKILFLRQDDKLAVDITVDRRVVDHHGHIVCLAKLHREGRDRHRSSIVDLHGLERQASRFFDPHLAAACPETDGVERIRFFIAANDQPDAIGSRWPANGIDPHLRFDDGIEPAGGL